VRATVRAIGGALTTPLLPEDFAGLLNPLWSGTALRGRVVEVRRETDRAATLRIRPGRGGACIARHHVVPVRGRLRVRDRFDLPNSLIGRGLRLKNASTGIALSG